MIMKKNFWILVSVLVALALGFASCGSGDDEVGGNPETVDNGDKGEESFVPNGHGTAVINGETFELIMAEVWHKVPWGGAPGVYIISLWTPSEVVDGEQWYSSPMDVIIADDHLNNTYDLTEDMNTMDGKRESSVGIDGWAYAAGGSYYKSGSIRVTLDAATRTLTIDTQGVVYNEWEDKEVTFSCTFTGTVNIYTENLAKEPDVPFGDGGFTGTGTVKIDGVSQSIGSPVNVYYQEGPTGKYSINFYTETMEWLASIDIPQTFVGDTFQLTDNLTANDSEHTYISLGSRMYDPYEKDFKSGTIFVSIDHDGNLKVVAKGVANNGWDPDDEDVPFEISFTGKGTVGK